MIYVNSDSDWVIFPRTDKNEYREYTLVLTNQTTQTKIVCKHLQNTSNNNSYYILSMLDAIPQMVVGQYDYEIQDPDTNAVLENNTMQFGEYVVRNTMAYNNSVKINSYNPYIPPTPKPKKTLDVSLNGEYDVEDYDLVDVDVFVPETEVVSKTYDDNGKYMIKPSSSDKVMSEVDVTVNVPKRKEEQVKSITIQSSGDYTVTPDEGKVLSEVDINVPTFKETYDFNEIGYTNDLIDFNSDIANTKLVYDRFNGSGSIRGSTFQDYIKSQGFDLVYFPNMSWDNGENSVSYGDSALCSGMSNLLTFPCESLGYYLDYCFQNCTSLNKMAPNLKIYPFGNVYSMTFMFSGCSSLKHLPEFEFSNGKKGMEVRHMFADCTKLVDFPYWLDLSIEPSPYGYYCDKVFLNCKSLTIDRDVTLNINNPSTVEGMFYGCSSLDQSKITINIDNTSGSCSSIANLFRGCGGDSLGKITITGSKSLSEGCGGMWAENSVKDVVIDFDASADCNNIVLDSKKTVTVDINLPNATKVNGAVARNDSMTTVKRFLAPNATYWRDIFTTNPELTTVEELDTTSATDLTLAFAYCRKMTDVCKFYCGNYTGSAHNFYATFENCELLTNVGGFTDWGKSVTSRDKCESMSLQWSSKLTPQSVDNIADTIYDMTGKSFSPYMKFHSTVYNNMTDEQKAKFAAKNWTVVSA